jgi:hypothetical protein
VRRFGIQEIASERQEVESKDLLRHLTHLEGKPKGDNSM